MAAKASFLDRGGESVTLQTRTLALPRDPETGWLTVTFADSTVRIYVEHLSSISQETPAGPVVLERLKMWTTAAINQRDRIVYHGDTYEIRTEPAEETESRFRGAAAFNTSILVKIT